VTGTILIVETSLAMEAPRWYPLRLATVLLIATY